LKLLCRSVSRSGIRRIAFCGHWIPAAAQSPDQAYRRRYVETVSYSATLFFHFIPGITETSTRLPPGSPLVANADAPALQLATGVLFVAFLIGATLQVRQLRSARLSLQAAPRDAIAAGKRA
jgi:hypothetical protein